MPNWCYNVLTFSGENEDKALELFKNLQEKCEREQVGVAPEFIENPDRYFFWVDAEDSVVHFQTKWSPPIQDMEKIGEHLNVDFELEYSETGCLIYGKLVRRDGELTDMYLEDDDFAQYQYNEEQDRYLFRGEHWEVEEEILELLFEEKYGKL